MNCYLVNLFTNAEKILLSKLKRDYRFATKEDLIENFTIKNLDTLLEVDNQNVKTKSTILAPFNSTILKSENTSMYFFDLQIENEVIKICGKAKEANRNYELNNNGEIDNGVLISKTTIISNISIAEEEDKANSKPISPANEAESKLTSPKVESNRYSKSHTLYDSTSNNTNTYFIDDLLISKIEEFGYSKEYVLKSLNNNELNHATATYFILLHNQMDSNVSNIN